MSKKSPKIATIISQCRGKHDPHYLAYFKCFNEGLYYEAHDVLEELWLMDRDSTEYGYYKGLIQAAGAFVHLQKQHQFPDHPTHGRRLSPASRLFTLAVKNLSPYGPHHLDFNVASFCRILETYREALIESRFQTNPYSPANAPQITLADTESGK